jgi:hypothetical protein
VRNGGVKIEGYPVYDFVGIHLGGFGEESEDVVGLVGIQNPRTAT